VAASPGERRAAALDGAGRLVDFALARPGTPDGIGDVHRGLVGRRVPAMAGAFVVIDHDVTGFLSDTEGAAGITEGAPITVRVTRAAQGGKGPRLAAVVSEAAAPARMGLVRRGPDAVLRLAALWPEVPVLVDDPALQARLAVALPGRVQPGAGFDAELESEIARLGEPEAPLPGGARASIHPTPALVAIDIDAGTATGQGNPPQALNQAAIPEIARQIRLRNLSGAILVDLAGLSVRGRKALAGDFAVALASDPLAPRFLGFTALGLAEIVRPRVAPPLHELLSEPLAAGLAALRTVAQESRATPGASFVLVAAPAVVTALHQDPVALDELARRTGRTLMLSSDPALGHAGWQVERVR